MVSVAYSPILRPLNLLFKSQPWGPLGLAGCLPRLTLELASLLTPDIKCRLPLVALPGITGVPARRDGAGWTTKREQEEARRGKI